MITIDDEYNNQTDHRLTETTDLQKPQTDRNHKQKLQITI